MLVADKMKNYATRTRVFYFILLEALQVNRLDGMAHKSNCIAKRTSLSTTHSRCADSVVLCLNYIQAVKASAETAYDYEKG